MLRDSYIFIATQVQLIHFNKKNCFTLNPQIVVLPPVQMQLSDEDDHARPSLK